MANILITNVYSVRNKGDQALFESLLRLFPQGADLAVLAVDSGAIARAYPQLDVFRLPWECRSGGKLFRRLFQVCGIGWFLFDILILRGRLSRAGKAIRAANTVVACPGGYLEDTSSSFLGMWLQLFAAVWLGKRVILSPQSIGPFHRRWPHVLTLWVLRRCEHTYLRESISADGLSADLAPERWSLSPDLVIPDPHYDGPGPSGKKIGMTLVDARYYLGVAGSQAYVDRIVSLIQELQAAGYEVEIVTQTVGFAGGSSDEDMIHAVQAKVGIKAHRIFDSVEAYLSHMDSYWVFIGSRLHSSLFALKRGIPAIALSYQPKADGIYASLTMQDWVHPIRSFDPKHVARQVCDLYDDGPTRREGLARLKQGLDVVRQQATAFRRCLGNL